MTPNIFFARLLPDSHRPEGIDAGTLEFLEHVGLPRKIVYGDNDVPGSLTFNALERGLLPLSSLPLTPPLRDEDFRDHFIIGEERHEGGSSPAWCLHVPSGRVDVLVDPEADELRIRTANSSVFALAATLKALRDSAQSKASLEALSAELERIDPATYRTSVWSVLVEHLILTGQPTVRFEGFISGSV